MFASKSSIDILLPSLVPYHPAWVELQYEGYYQLFELKDLLPGISWFEHEKKMSMSCFFYSSCLPVKLYSNKIIKCLNWFPCICWKAESNKNQRLSSNIQWHLERKIRIWIEDTFHGNSSAIDCLCHPSSACMVALPGSPPRPPRCSLHSCSLTWLGSREGLGCQQGERGTRSPREGASGAWRRRLVGFLFIGFVQAKGQPVHFL